MQLEVMLATPQQKRYAMQKALLERARELGVLDEVNQAVRRLEEDL